MKIFVGDSIIGQVESSSNDKEVELIKSDKIYVDVEADFLRHVPLAFKMKLAELSKCDMPTINGFCGQVLQLTYEFTGDEQNPYRLYSVDGVEL